MTDVITPEEYKEYLKNKAGQKDQQNKYRNKRVKVQEVQPDKSVKEFTIDSIGEKQYYDELKFRKKSGDIMDFKRQVTFKLAVNGVHITSYKADFVVWDRYGNKEVIDYKSDFTRKLRLYQIKKALMLAIHGITIKEVTK